MIRYKFFEEKKKWKIYTLKKKKEDKMCELEKFQIKTDFQKVKMLVCEVICVCCIKIACQMWILQLFT